MPEYNVSFEAKRSDTMELPGHLLKSGSYSVTVDSDGSVSIEGDRNGLLFLGETLVRAAIGGFDRGFHVHLPLHSHEPRPNIDARPELTIYAATHLRRS